MLLMVASESTTLSISNSLPIQVTPLFIRGQKQETTGARPRVVPETPLHKRFLRVDNNRIFQGDGEKKPPRM